MQHLQNFNKRKANSIVDPHSIGRATYSPPLNLNEAPIGGIPINEQNGLSPYIPQGSSMNTFSQDFIPQKKAYHTSHSMIVEEINQGLFKDGEIF